MRLFARSARLYGRKPLPADTGLVYLSASQLEKFCQHALEHKDSLFLLLARIAYDERLKKSIKLIEERHSKNKDADNLNPAALANSVSALKTIMSDPAIAQIYARQHRMSMDRELPGRITQEIGILEGVLDHYQQSGKGDVPFAAIRDEFAGLLSFGREILDVIARADAKDPPKKAEQNKALHVFHDLGLGDVEPYYGHIIDALKIYYKQAGSPLRRTGLAAWDTTKDFVGDLINFVRESPKVALPVIGGLSGLLYYFGSGGNVPETSNTIMIFGENGYEMIPIDASTLPAEALREQNWHYDMGPFGLYKHYMFNNAVTGPVEKTLDGFRIATQWAYEQVGIEPNLNNAFAIAADQVVRPYADQLFKVNMIQNFTHAGFWTYAYGHGLKHGFSGMPKVIKLFAPLADIGWEVGTNAAEKLHLKKRQPHAIAEHTLQKLKMDAAITVELLKEKKSLAREFAKVAGIGTAAALASSVALDMAGAGSTISDALSQAAGYGTAGTLTTSTFLVYNFVEDILGVHVAGGAMLMGAGAATNYAYQRGLKPAWRGARESLQSIQKFRTPVNDAAAPAIEA
jgi:hypothetical protein